MTSPSRYTSSLLTSIFFFLTLHTLSVHANVYTCENSAMIYTVNEDDLMLLILQVNNETRAYEMNATSWDDYVPASDHGKSCDFHIESRPQAATCVSTREGDDENAFCQGDKNENVDVIAEHEVLVACTGNGYAYAKIESVNGVHFMAAFKDEQRMKQSEEWDPSSFMNSVEAFQAKLDCDDDDSATSGVSSLQQRDGSAMWLLGLLFILGSFA